MNLRELFESNIRLMGFAEKAILLFRRGRYDEALGMVADSADGINKVCDAVLADRSFFKSIPSDFVGEMLEAVIAAKKNRDYVLLADLYEMQLSPFVCNVQELIMTAEDLYGFDVSTYNRRIRLMEQKLTAGIDQIVGNAVDDDERERLRVNRNAELESPLSPEELLSKGYSVEFSSSGLMTVRVPSATGAPIYLHTNGNILRESFLLADDFRTEGIDQYIVFGLGMGYHISELLELDRFAKVTVFESDINILKLYAAFSDGTLLENRRFGLVYDPERTLIEQRLLTSGANEKGCVHYPSMRRAASGKKLTELAPFADIVERC